MAAVVLPHHASLVAATALSVDCGADYEAIEVLNRTGTAEIYFTTDGTTPVSGADGTHVVPAAMGAALMVACPENANTTVKLICASVQAFTVSGA